MERDGESVLGDVLRDQGALSPIHGAIESDIGEQTAGVLKTLSPKEEKVIRMRFGIGFDRDRTLAEIGREFGVTRERIRQIEVKAMGKLREPQRAGAVACANGCQPRPHLAMNGHGSLRVTLAAEARVRGHLWHLSELMAA